MTAEDYGRFMLHNFPAARDPFARPHVNIAGGAYYGQGMLFREWRGGHNYWHYGMLCFRKNSAHSYAASLATGWLIITGFDGCLGIEKLRELENALLVAAIK